MGAELEETRLGVEEEEVSEGLGGSSNDDEQVMVKERDRFLGFRFVFFAENDKEVSLRVAELNAIAETTAFLRMRDCLTTNGFYQLKQRSQGESMVIRLCDD